MITRDRKLAIFESFRVDRGLPKFKPKDEFCDLNLDKIAQILGSEAIKDSAVTGIEDLRIQR